MLELIISFICGALVILAGMFFGFLIFKKMLDFTIDHVTQDGGVSAPLCAPNNDHAIQHPNVVPAEMLMQLGLYDGQVIVCEPGEDFNDAIRRVYNV